MQKFTRAITREVELAGERLAFTFDAEGITVRPVGSRRPPHGCSWASVAVHLAREDAPEPPSEDVAAAVGRLKAGGKAAERPSAKEPETAGPDQEPPSPQSQPQAGAEAAV
jgi:hypothetical protein